MAGDSQTPRRFRCLIKHFWDIIMKVVPKVYFLLWCQSHWPSSCVSEECSKSEHLNRHLPVLSAPIVVFRSKLSWYCFYFNKLGCINILISFLRSKNIVLTAWKFKECLGWNKLLIVIINLSHLLMIFRSEWTKLKYTLNLVRCFLLHSTKFQYFFMDSKVNCQIHMITDMFKNI